MFPKGRVARLMPQSLGIQNVSEQLWLHQYCGQSHHPQEHSLLRNHSHLTRTQVRLHTPPHPHSPRTLVMVKVRLALATEA